jgi:prevent-host-death family protein
VEVRIMRASTGAAVVVMSTRSLRDLRNHLSEVVDRVQHHHERVVVRRNGKPAAVIVSPEDLAQMQETIDVLSDPTTLAGQLPKISQRLLRRPPSTSSRPHC